MNIRFARLSNCRVNFDIDIKICNNRITRVGKSTFIGLTWRDQINNVNTDLSRISGVMYGASHVLGTTGLLLTLEYSLLLSVLVVHKSVQKHMWS